MWRLGLGGGGEAAPRLPERPGEANCIYYLRTGSCSYGESCRYNHPRDRAAAVSYRFSSLGSISPPSVMLCFASSLQCTWGLVCYDSPVPG